MVWIALGLTVVLVFFIERPGERESRLVSALIYAILGFFPLHFTGFSLPLGIPAALLLLLRKVDNRLLKIVAALVGAAVSWVYYTWFWTPG